MSPPIKVDFVIDPFFQNHPSYLESFSFSELTGSVGDVQPSKHCKLGSEVNASGFRLFPCGLQANSLFNDTFTLRDGKTGELLHLGTDGIAWQSDLRRFENPQGYPHRLHDFSWLFQRFPTVIPKLGVRAEALAVWLRPAATPRVQKPYAILADGLRAGQTIDIHIDANFPVSTIDAKKLLLLTTSGPLGGVSDLFGRFLLAAGSICWLAALLVLAIRLFCGRQLGEARRRCVAVSPSGKSQEQAVDPAQVRFS